MLWSQQQVNEELPQHKLPFKDVCEMERLIAQNCPPCQNKAYKLACTKT